MLPSKKKKKKTLTKHLNCSILTTQHYVLICLIFFLQLPSTKFEEQNTQTNHLGRVRQHIYDIT